HRASCSRAERTALQAATRTMRGTSGGAPTRGRGGTPPDTPCPDNPSAGLVVCAGDVLEDQAQGREARVDLPAVRVSAELHGHATRPLLDRRRLMRQE